MAIRAQQPVVDRAGVVSVGTTDVRPWRMSRALRQEGRRGYALLTPTLLVILFRDEVFLRTAWNSVVYTVVAVALTGVPVSYAGSPTPAAGEVLNTHVIATMIQRVLVENWEAGKALEECHKRIVEIYARYAKG